ncbi:MAG: L,D-transpeptidase family protein [Mariprofundaceae bacterium]
MKITLLSLAIFWLCLSPGNMQLLHATAFDLPPPGENLVGNMQTVSTRYEDTLLDIARRFDLGYEDIVLANPQVDIWLPGEGTQVVLPNLFILPDAPREGIVINLAEMRLYYYPKLESGNASKQGVIVYPVSIGRQNWQTPIVLTRVTDKRANPVWHPPASILKEHTADGYPLPDVVPSGPQNPLGLFALYLDLPQYLIHGTNKAFGIGMTVTHGCIRLYPEDIEALFQSVPLGTSVRIINQPYKAGWRNGSLYLEVHPLLNGEAGKKDQGQASLTETIMMATKSQPDYPVDWTRVLHIARHPRGIPISIVKKP